MMMGSDCPVFFPSKKQVVSRWISPLCITYLLAKACLEELEGLLEFLHRRHNCRSLGSDERKSNLDAKEITPACKRPSPVLVASSSNRLPPKGFRWG